MIRYFGFSVPGCRCFGARACAWTHGNICQRFSCLIFYRFQSQHLFSRAVTELTQEECIFWDTLHCCRVCFLFRARLWTILHRNGERPARQKPPSVWISSLFYLFNPSAPSWMNNSRFVSKWKLINKNFFKMPEHLLTGTSEFRHRWNISWTWNSNCEEDEQMDEQTDSPHHL